MPAGRRRFSTGNYINFQSADEGEGRIRESYGASFGRLAALKARYDPENPLPVEPQHRSRGRRGAWGVQVTPVSIGERVFIAVGVALVLAALALIVAMLIDVSGGADGGSRPVTNVTLGQ